MDPVSHLRASLLPLLHACGEELRKEHPGVTVNIYDWPVGELTDWRGHDIGIECVFKNAASDFPDNVALAVSLKHLPNAAAIASADVVWGHPSGKVEASLLPAPVEFSPERLAEIVRRVPELVSALRQAVRRGQPSS